MENVLAHASGTGPAVRRGVVQKAGAEWGGPKASGSVAAAEQAALRASFDEREVRRQHEARRVS
jgi:hypothetical protein